MSDTESEMLLYRILYLLSRAWEGARGPLEVVGTDRPDAVQLLEAWAAFRVFDQIMTGLLHSDDIAVEIMTQWSERGDDSV